MMSRPTDNLDKIDLRYLEDSTDLNDYQGFIRNQNVKKLFVRQIIIIKLTFLGYYDEAFHTLY